MQLWESILIDWKYLCKFCNEFSSGSRFIPIVEKFLLVPYPIASNFRPALFPIFFLLLNFWRRADWSMAILGELFFPIPWHRQIWKWRELSRRARSRMEAQHKTRYAMGKKKKKEERKRNKRRIRKRRRCLAKEMIEHFDDDVTTTEYFTIPRSISVCQPINSLLPFFFSFSLLSSPPPLSSFREFLQSAGRWYRAGNNFRANQSKRWNEYPRERTPASFSTCKLKIFRRVSSFTFLSPFANPPLKIPYFLTRQRIKEIEMVP